ncbi:MAG TPA: hypothetical protein PLZ02_01250 [Candidatus Woesebacteria bacterium]|nr:hypothetical protein [Candidatus Woesebacteria bacterium]
MPKNRKIVVFLIVLLIVSLVIWKYQQKSAVEQISSFEECARAGYPVLESYPEQCRTPNGESFTRQIPNQQNLQQETVEEIGLSFQYPTDLLYRKEIADNDGNIRTVGFFLTKGSEQNPEYQMYGLYENYRNATKDDLERAKTEMDPTTIKEVNVGGYKGIEGLITGPKTRHITIILKDDKLFSISTLPPTEDNKSITEQILSTFQFN